MFFFTSLLNEVKVGGPAFNKLNAVNENVLILSHLHERIVTNRLELLKILNVKDKNFISREWDRINSNEDEIEVMFDILLAKMGDPERIKMILIARSFYSDFAVTRDNHLIPKLLLGKHEQAKTLAFGEQDFKITKVLDLIEVVSSLEEESLEEIKRSTLSFADSQYHRILYLLIGVNLLMLFLIFSGMRSLQKAFASVINSARSISRGNFSERTFVEEGSEFGELAFTLNNMLDKIESSKNKFEKVFNFAPVGILLYRKNLEVEMINRVGLEILKKDRIGLEAVKVSSLFTNSEGNSLDQFSKAIETEEDFSIEGKGRLEDGERINLDLAVSRIVIDGKTFGLIAFKDITEEVKLREDLANSVEDLEHFSYIATHDLNEPLRKIQGYGEILLEDHYEDLDEDAQNCIRVMQDGAIRMSSLISSLLSFFRVSKKALKKKKTSLSDIVNDAKSYLEVSVNETSSQIELRGAAVINCSREMLTLVFQNLFSNAMKFRVKDSQPKITIDTEVINSEFIKISVCDNGIGIDPEYAQRIFQPFKRLHTRTEYKGNGIGLSICKKILEKHNGRIYLDNSYKKGSKFTIELPY